MYAFLRRQRPAPMLVAVLALFVALGGTAVAGKLITSKKIKNNSITGIDVKDESLTPDDFSGSVQGPQGPRGLQGPAGPAGPVNLRYVVSDFFSVGANSQGFGTADCPADQSVIGGGVLPDGDAMEVSVNGSYPGDNSSDADTVRDDRWAVYINNNGPWLEEFKVYAICTTADSTS
jgi:hypothetical protein